MSESEALSMAKQSPYLRLVRFGFEKSCRGETFTNEEARNACQLGEEEFKPLGRMLFKDLGYSTDEKVVLVPDAFVAYLEFEQLNAAIESGEMAERHSRTSTMIAICAIAISFVTLVVSIWQSRQPTDLSPKTLQNLSSAVAGSSVIQPEPKLGSPAEKSANPSTDGSLPKEP